MKPSLLRRTSSGARPPGRGGLALGMMSGTSADGIDVALVRFAGQKPSLENFAAFPFPTAIQKDILRVAEGRPTTTGEISRLNFDLGETFARAALAACKRFRVPAARIDVIGSHGQTVFHQGTASSSRGGSVASTLQIGEPSVIAVRTGITTVGDFRPADMAAGGQGAPLVPFVDFLLYRHGRIGRAALNIGGIANITVIPAGADLEDVFAFDTGPGNMVIDALVKRSSRGRKTYDRNAAIGVKGNLLPRLLDDLLRDRYFAAPPPKTAGREQYGEKYVNDFLADPEARRAKPEDLVRTATILTSLSILDAIHRYVTPRAKIEELIVSGGGANNPLLMGQIQSGLKSTRLRKAEDFGLPGAAKEAFAFAVLAWETLHRQPANVPRATGAKKAVVLGKICYGQTRLKK